MPPLTQSEGQISPKLKALATRYFQAAKLRNSLKAELEQHLTYDVANARASLQKRYQESVTNVDLLRAEILKLGGRSNAQTHDRIRF